MFMINDEGDLAARAARGSARRSSSSRRSRRAGRTAPRTTGWPTPTRSSARSTTSASSSRASGPTTSAGTRQHSNAPGTTCFLPVVDNTRQYINVLLILLSEPHGKAPLFIDDWRPFRPERRRRVDRRGRRPRSALVDPIPYQPIGGLKRVRGGFVDAGHAGADRRLGDRSRTDHEAYFLLQNLMLHRRGAAPRRLGPRRADDPRTSGTATRRRGTSASASASTAPSPRRALASAGRRCRPRSPTSSASTACWRACARRTSPTWTRPSTRSSRRSSAPGGAYADPRSSARPTRTRRARRGYLRRAAAPPARGGQVHEGDLPLPGRDLRALPGAHRRLPPPGHLGAVLAPGDRVLRALRQPRARAARGRGPGDLGPLMRRQPRIGRDDRPDDCSRRSGPQWLSPVLRSRLLRAGGSSCRSRRTHILQFDFIHFVRWTIVRTASPGEKLALPLPVLREQLRRAVAALHRRVRLRHPASDIRFMWGRGPSLPRRRRRPSR